MGQEVFFMFDGFLHGLHPRLKLDHEPKLRKSWEVESIACYFLQLALVFWLVSFFLGAGSPSPAVVF